MMLGRNLHLFLFIIFFIFEGKAQSIKLVHIKGYAPSYVNQPILFNEIEDYFSLKEKYLAQTTVKADSTFEVSFYIPETQKIMVRPGKNESFLYVSPGSSYEIFLPKSDYYNAYRSEGNKIETTFFNLDSNDINFKILKFQRWADEFVATYHYLKDVKPIEFGQKLDEFKSNVQKYYGFNKIDSTHLNNTDFFFATTVRFTLAQLDNIPFAGERNRDEKHDFYIKNSPVYYKNDTYMNYINSFYEKLTPRLSMETNNRVYLGLLKSSPTLIMRALGLEYTLINVRIRELVMIKMLSEQFFSSEFPQTNVLTVLDSVSNHSLFKANAIFASNMMARLTELTIGGKAPEFVIKNQENETKTLYSFKRKHLYLHFFDPSKLNNTIEIDPLLKIYDTYKNHITFVTIYPDKSYTDKDLEHINRLPWEKCKTEQSNPIWERYKITSYPSYVLLDGFGYVVGAPALGPMPNGQYQTIDQTFFNIQKMIEQLKKE